MRKLGVVILALALAALIGTVALAAGPGSGPANCPMYGAGASPEQTQKFTQFQNEIVPLKQKMVQLKTELMTLKVQQNPDWKAIAAKQKEMVDVRIEIQKKAAESGFAGCGMGRGMGRGMGTHQGMGMGRMGQ
jgi:hypothetical protein